METLIILLVFVGCPLALVAFIVIGAMHRAKQRKHVADAAQKYLTS